MRKAGRLIVFEGPDGSGKSTLSRRLVAALRKSGKSCVHLAFPGNERGTLGHLVYRLHHKPTEFGIARPNPASLQLLHLAAHIEAINKKILPALKKGHWVILDRYWWSLWVYGRVGGIAPEVIVQMIEIEKDYWGDISPLVFLIVRKNKLSSLGKKLLKEYTELAAIEGQVSPVHIIDNSKTIENTMQNLKNIVEAVPNVSAGVSRGKASIKVSPLGPAVPTVVYDTYWRFAAERQSIFFKRLKSEPQPWTNDPILSEFKFTNAYRASDRVSQYLIKNVIYSGEQTFEEVFFRTILFKFFNRIETWELLEKKIGEIKFKGFSIEKYNRVLSEAMQSGSRVYSPAYIMPSGGPNSPWPRKHSMHLQLLQRMMREDLPAQIADTKYMSEGFELLRGYPTIGDFLAYQYITDLNYSAFLKYSEMEFTIPGPGAKDGIRKCFSNLGGLTEAEIIQLVAKRQEMEFARLGLDFKSLWGRPLQLIDCQNLFCEVDKYSRVKHPEFSGNTGRTRIKQKFSPTKEPVRFWYPPKWGINEKIASEV